MGARLTLARGMIPVNSESGILTPLEWDSQRFGFPVARIGGTAAQPAELAEALAVAKARGIHLVYCSSSPEQTPPDEILAEFSGILADRKATFRRELSATEEPLPPDESQSLTPRVYPRGEASPALVQLALAAGEHSRFRVDRRFPKAAFEGLYRTWIERSTQGEIAETVLVLTPDTDAADPHGMVTISVEGSIGRIGLIAVDARTRGKGVGRALMRLAHHWMLRWPCASAEVITQLSNAAACRLYQSAGYRLDTIQHVYHFWPQIDRRRLVR